MHVSNSFIATNLAVAARLATADTNPDAEGACDKTTGGDNACGPNGSQAWLNTGVKGDGWQPPFLDINKLQHVSLEEYYQGTGKACAQYDEFFKSSGQKYNIDPAILAFLAFQESSCNADEGGPTPGLMQCDPSNCNDGNGGDCQYPVQDNTDCGAFVLRRALDDSNQNAVSALGSYNGWFTAGSGLNGNRGLTEDYPCSGEGQSHGVPQNLNYLHEVLNGFLVGLDPYSDQSIQGEYNCDQQCNDGSLC